MVVFSRVDVAAHKTLAEQMAEWEADNEEINDEE